MSKQVETLDEAEVSIKIFHKVAKASWIYFPGQLMVLGAIDVLLVGYIPSHWLLIWNLLHILNLLFRHRLIRHHLAKMDSEKREITDRYLRQYFLSLLFTGLLWAGVVPMLHYVPENAYFLIYSMIVMMTFASTTSIGPVKRYFLAFALPMNIAMLVDLLLHGGRVYYLAALSLVFSLYFSMRSSSMHLKEYTRILRDEARANRLRRHFERLASTDLLTGLPNRYKFFEYFEEALDEARKNHKSCVLFFLDLDRFKAINDTYGHHVGDRVLETIGSRLKKLLRGKGVAARLAGDEFVILLQHHQNPEEIEALIDELRQTLSRPITIENLSVSVTASIGIVRFPDHGDNPHDLLRCADSAMYLSKTHGTPQWYRDA